MIRIAPIAVCALLTAAPFAARADIYECHTPSGPRYTDAKDPGCILVLRDPAQTEEPAPDKLTEPVNSARRRALQPTIHAAALRHGVLPSLLEALIQVESGFRSTAVSVKGAMGLTQLMPTTAALLGVRDAFDAGANIDGGARHLRGLLDRYRGDVRLALAAYNAGAGAVERYGSTVPPFRETQEYVLRVTRLQRQLERTASRRSGSDT